MDICKGIKRYNHDLCVLVEILGEKCNIKSTRVIRHCEFHHNLFHQMDYFPLLSGEHYLSILQQHPKTGKMTAQIIYRLMQDMKP